MDINGIKLWLEDAIDYFGEVDPTDGSRRDIQENIKENRRIFGIPYRKREEIKAWVLVNKPVALPYLVELKNWMESYYHYFDTNFRSEWSIDELPSMILERLKWIRERIEAL